MNQKLYRDLVYFDDERYPSYEDLKYAGIYICLFLSLIMLMCGIASKNAFLVVVVLLYDILYVVFLHVIRSRNIKKIYSLRFLVNGISSVFVSIFFLLLSFIPVIVMNHNALAWILIYIFSCVLFVLLSCIAIWVCIRKGVFDKAIKSKKLKIISAISVSLIPVSGLIGYSIAKFMNSIFKINNKTMTYITFFVWELMILISTLGIVLSFMKYYYCRKYSITCDEDGDTTSPLLEPPKKVKKARTWKPNRFVKILIIIASIIGFFLACILIAGIILAIIKVING